MQGHESHAHEAILGRSGWEPRSQTENPVAYLPSLRESSHLQQQNISKPPFLIHWDFLFFQVILCEKSTTSWWWCHSFEESIHLLILLGLLKPWVRAHTLEMKHPSNPYPSLLSLAPWSISSAWYVFRSTKWIKEYLACFMSNWTNYLALIAISYYLSHHCANVCPVISWSEMTGSKFNWRWHGRSRAWGSKGQEDHPIFLIDPSGKGIFPFFINYPLRSKARGHLRNVRWTRLEIGRH